MDYLAQARMYKDTVQSFSRQIKADLEIMRNLGGSAEGEVVGRYEALEGLLAFFISNDAGSLYRIWREEFMEGYKDDSATG